MRRYCLLLFLIASFLSHSQEVYLDHVIYQVFNLDSITNDYYSQGFTIKPGIRHKNGIENAHLKFNNGSSLEFIALYKDPTDAIAKNYQRILKSKMEVVKIALTGLPLKHISKTLRINQIKHQIIEGKLWSYLTFPEETPLTNFFFIEYHHTFNEHEKYTKHRNGINSIEMISMEYNHDIKAFLSLFITESNSNDFNTKTGNIHLNSNSKNLKQPIVVRLK
ncbi:VOC family protein [Urechidicola vernalis]|uniref:VOC family protein n=1 Tax=Urechidicola vernalis TaxID=3075600 RepID=A0ABU2Y2D6_9FLAO|nr:VOC family protein [Urechidicola sp. P050]MDT0552369.1 VOC family protein [Urechidicola sp. P050]